MSRQEQDRKNKNAERARKRARGFTLVQVWVHKRDRERFDRYVERLNKARGL